MGRKRCRPPSLPPFLPRKGEERERESERERAALLLQGVFLCSAKGQGGSRAIRFPLTAPSSCSPPRRSSLTLTLPLFLLFCSFVCVRFSSLFSILRIVSLFSLFFLSPFLSLLSVCAGV